MDNDDVISNTSKSNPEHSNHSRNYETENFQYEDDDNDQSESFDESITISIPTGSLEHLLHASDIKQVSLGTAINQIIKDHLDWH